jgi:sigma-B regulation protein RsbU (phosphoserine phosphatase)
MNDDLTSAPATLVPQRLRGLFNRLEDQQPDGGRLEAFVEEVFEELRRELHLAAVLMYAERRDGFELRVGYGRHAAPVDLVPEDCPCLRLVLQHRVYIFADPQEPASPWTSRLLPCQPAAGVAVGRRPHRHLLFFLLEGGWVREHLDFALNVLRAGLGLRLLEERVQSNLREAAEVQESLLREEPPDLPGFEIACRSLSAEEVSGDFCDFVHVSRDLVGFAVGDAAGHGLPAALLVRDVVTGLRMGLEKHLRMEYVFSKLNRVIHRSNISSRYVSLFYGELETNGNLAYVNAGHQPPLLARKDRLQELRMGGAVIGPLPDVSFRRGFIRLDPGNVLVLLTDGLVERTGPSGEFFGEERLKTLVQENYETPAGDLADRILEATLAHGGGQPWDDDVTLMVVRRQGE